MTDAEWAQVRPLLPLPAWLRGRGGQPEAYCHRVMLDAIRYLVDNGIKWRAMPVDFPPWDRVYAFFRRWRDHDLVGEFHDRLRGEVRETLGSVSATSWLCGVFRSCGLALVRVVGAGVGGWGSSVVAGGGVLVWSEGGDVGACDAAVDEEFGAGDEGGVVAG